MKTVLFVIGAALALAQQTVQQPAAEAPKKIRVTGNVVALNGEPVRRAVLRLQGQPPSIYTASTGDDGKFAFDDVAPGRYTLLADKAGFVPQTYGARSSTGAAAPLILTAGQDLKDISIQMTPQGIISGHVSDADGDPAPMVMVSLQRYTYVRGRRQLSSNVARQTDDQGDYRIANLVPGHYYLYARDNRAVTTSASRASSQEINVQTYYPSALEPAGATPLDVTPGGELRGINIQLRKGRVYAIRGKLLDPSSGASPGGIPVELASQDTANGTSNMSRAIARLADGEFEFRNLAPGTYVLRALPGNMRGADGKPVPSVYTGRTEVTLANSSVEDAVLPLSRGFEIEGTVKLEDGDLKKLVTPPPPAVPKGTIAAAEALDQLQAAVMLADGGLTILNGGTPGRVIIQLSESYAGTTFALPTQTIKEDGAFRFQGLRASTYLLAVGGLPDETYVKSVKLGERDVTQSALELSGGGSLTVVLSSKAGSVSGTARNGKGEPLGGYLVSLWPKISDLGSPTGGVKIAITDQNGAFKFPSLAPGDYFVAAWDDLDQGLAQFGDFLAHFNGDASAVTVGESGQASVDAKVIGRDRVAAEIAKLP